MIGGYVDTKETIFDYIQWYIMFFLIWIFTSNLTKKQEIHFFIILNLAAFRVPVSDFRSPASGFRDSEKCGHRNSGESEIGYGNGKAKTRHTWPIDDTGIVTVTDKRVSKTGIPDTIVGTGSTVTHKCYYNWKVLHLDMGWTVTLFLFTFFATDSRTFLHFKAYLPS